MKLLQALCLLLVLQGSLFGQSLKHTIRGVVTDADSKRPLVGVNIVVDSEEFFSGTTTNLQGEYRLEEVPIGRHTIKFTYLGYEAGTAANVVLKSGKETILNFDLTESTIELDEMVVIGKREKGKALNEMSLVSSRSVSLEETERYAGSFNDPSRLLSNYAGVTNTQEGSNDIIVRGNSPKYVQWRLEGTDITVPNHFGDQNNVSGGISALNNNLLATSDFHTGAFSAEFGNVLSGVYDVRLRNGNDEKFESIFGFGLLGTDLTFEGPLRAGSGASFLVNYRYSTATILDQLGLLDVGGVPKFQDAAFKINLPTKKIGDFSIHGLGGLSVFEFTDVLPSLWDTPGDAGLAHDTEEDFIKDAHLLNVGLSHRINIGDRAYLKSTASYSSNGIADEVYLRKTTGELPGSKTLNWQSDLKESTYRFSSTYNYKLNARHKFQAGVKINNFNFDYNQSQLDPDGIDRIQLTDFQDQVNNIQSFLNWKYRIGDHLTLVYGLHNNNVLFNKQSTIENRLALNWSPSAGNIVSFAYGEHSEMESIHHYFAREENEQGVTEFVNKDLGLLKARHYVLGYKKRLSEVLMANVNLYYQGLYNLPVASSTNSHFATINEGLEYQFIDLVNEGKGQNYGVEFTLERFFSKQYYFLINASLYESNYTALDRVERSTSFNGKYLANVLAGKEFPKWGKKRNQTFSIDTKLFFGGGRPVIPLLRDANGILAVNPSANQYWDYENAYLNKLEDVYSVTVSLTYQFDRQKTTHELYLNLDNISNAQANLNEFYDENADDGLGYITQFGFFPNLIYKVYF